MKNYLEKYRKFGEAFRELMRDRPTIMITDDHDVFANDLWGKGGLRMKGDRTTGGYPTHPAWVNAAEFTQTGHLPDPAIQVHTVTECEPITRHSNMEAYILQCLRIENSKAHSLKSSRNSSRPRAFNFRRNGKPI